MSAFVPIPQKGAAYSVRVPILNSSGALITTGLTGIAATISKDGGAYAPTTNAPTETPALSGYLSLDVTTTENNANNVVVKFAVTNANALLQAAQWNPQASSSQIPVDANITQFLGTLLTESVAGNLAASFKSLFDNTDAVQKIWDKATSALTTAGSIGKLLVDNINATISSRSTLAQADIRTALGMASANLDTQLTNIQTDTTNLINRLGAFAGTTTNNVLGFLRAIMRSDLAAPSDVGGTFDPATDSEQAIADAIGSIPTADQWATNLVTGGYTGNEAGAIVLAIKAKTDTIGATSVVVVSPVIAAGNLALVAGDDYLAADGRALDFTYTGQPSIIGAAALLRFTPLGSNASYNIGTDLAPVYYLTGSILSATEVQFEMTSAQSARLPANTNGGNNARFEVQITLADGSVITPTPLNLGKVSVSPQAAP